MATTPTDGSATRTVPRLHVITPEGGGPKQRSVTSCLVRAGTPLLQVRQKSMSDRALVNYMAAIVDERKTHGEEHHTVLLVDDRADVALAAGADGVHVGADDLPAGWARRILGASALVGATARTATDARHLEAAGADYLGVGPVFRSSTKTDGLPDPIGIEGLAEVVAAVAVPVIAIAGIGIADVEDVLGAGAHGIAVCEAVFGADDPILAMQDLCERLGGR